MTESTSTSITNDLAKIGEVEVRYSATWIGQDGRKWRTASYHLGGGQWTAGFLQWEDDLCNWHGH